MRNKLSFKRFTCLNKKSDESNSMLIEWPLGYGCLKFHTNNIIIYVQFFTSLVMTRFLLRIENKNYRWRMRYIYTSDEDVIDG